LEGKSPPWHKRSPPKEKKGKPPGEKFILEKGRKRKRESATGHSSERPCGPQNKWR